MKKLY